MHYSIQCYYLFIFLLLKIHLSLSYNYIPVNVSIIERYYIPELTIARVPLLLYAVNHAKTKNCAALNALYSLYFCTLFCLQFNEFCHFKYNFKEHEQVYNSTMYRYFV